MKMPSTLNYGSLLTSILSRATLMILSLTVILVTDEVRALSAYVVNYGASNACPNAQVSLTTELAVADGTCQLFGGVTYYKVNCNVANPVILFWTGSATCTGLQDEGPFSEQECFPAGSIHARFCCLSPGLSFPASGSVCDTWAPSASPTKSPSRSPATSTQAPSSSPSSSTHSPTSTTKSPTTSGSNSKDKTMAISTFLTCAFAIIYALA